MTQTSRKFPYGSFISNYAQGLKLSNNAVTPDEQLDVAVGSILDSTGTFQLSLDTAVTIDVTNSGLNGLDTGTLAASKLYAVFLVSDPVTLQASGAMLSLSTTAPVMPFGYSAFALIGYAVSDATADLLLGYWTAGNGGTRQFTYDAPQVTSITAGAATSYTAVALTTLVPAVEDTRVSIAFDMTPAAASRIMSLQPFGAVGDAVSITSQVTAVHVTGNVEVGAKLNAAAPSIEYKWSAGGSDAVALNVAGYQFYI